MSLPKIYTSSEAAHISLLQKNAVHLLELYANTPSAHADASSNTLFRSYTKFEDKLSFSILFFFNVILAVQQMTRSST